MKNIGYKTLDLRLIHRETSFATPFWSNRARSAIFCAKQVLLLQKKKIVCGLWSIVLCLNLPTLWLNANMEMGMDYLKKGVSLWNEEFLLKAEKEFQKEENYYYLSLVQYRLATFYLVSEKNEQAKRYAEKGIENIKFAVEKNNNSAASYTILGNLYGVITGLSDNPLLQAKYGYFCLKNVKQAVEMEPKNSFSLLSLGITYFNTPEEYGGGIDKAVEMLDKAIASDRGNVEAYIWLSRCYIKKGEIDKAKGFLRKALD
ncbi:MAG: tetratricopeptide repeat protein, partial [Candidatus Cloacimonadota bacterium]